MTLFQDQGFQKVKGFIPSFFSTYLRNYFTLRVQTDSSLRGDEQAPNSHCVYGDPAFDMVMAMSTEDIGNIVGKNLIPQYTYARIYKNGSDLKIHSDRPECQYSVTLCLGGEYEKPWPIWIKDYAGNMNEIPLDVGDMVVYHGTELEHWREKFEGNTQYQLFMHYVDSEGEFKDRVFDGRSNLGLKKMIPQLINELFAAKEFPAARELAIAYLRNQKDEDIMFLLAGIHHEEKNYDKALECVEKVTPNPTVLIHKAKILYYLERAPEAEAILRSLPKKYKSDEGYIIDLGLYMTSQGKLNQTRKLLAPIADTNVRASFNYGWHLLAEDKFQEGYKYIRAGAIDELRVWGHEWILSPKK